MRTPVAVSAFAGVCLLATLASDARSGKGVKPITHTSPNGFSIAVPSGWTAQNPGDEQFFAVVPTGEFADNLTLTYIGPLSLDKATMTALEKAFVDEYQSTFPDFTLDGFKKTKFGKNEGLHVLGSFTVEGIAVNLDQALIPSKAGTVIASCVIGKKRKKTSGKLCQTAFASVSFEVKFSPRGNCDEPGPPGFATALQGARLEKHLDLDGDGTKDLLVADADECDARENCTWAIWLMRGSCGYHIGDVEAFEVELGKGSHLGMRELAVIYQNRMEEDGASIVKFGTDGYESN